MSSVLVTRYSKVPVINQGRRPQVRGLVVDRPGIDSQAESDQDYKSWYS